jgi:glutathione S-transferase
MAITLYHHPFSRAASTVWALEEVGAPYQLEFVDMLKGEHKGERYMALNPMGKLPILTDGDVVVTEVAAIALYLADRYAAGRLAPALDDPRRAAYLRWSLFAPSVIEPASMAKLGGWDYKASQAGWGDHASVMQSIEAALAGKAFLLGDEFSMADVIFGGTVRYMVMFKMMDATPAVAGYIERLNARPASQRAAARNQAIIAERGLGK